jgi:hypothetical protein
MRLKNRVSAVAALAAFCWMVAGTAFAAPAPRHAAARPASAADFQAALISPQALLAQLKEPAARRPVVLQVGFDFLYRGAHIPGAIFTGPGSTAAGIAALKRAAARIPRTREVVIYCGCCPMNKCPNIHPAFDALSSMGFRQLKVLNLPDDFARDWVEPGYPVVKGPNPR